jgi:sugar transferase EpsL
MLKRMLDVTVAALGLMILGPVLVALALAVRIGLGTPVLFTQTRPGLRGQPFTLYKFRTMTDARDADGHLLPDGGRLTRLGRFLRASSMDELPELWNVLKGDMSLVGPRPLLMQYLPLYNDFQARRHEVRPGLTGWAQVNGRNDIPWKERFDMDVWYVDNHSLWLDTKILLLTVVRVFGREGVNQDGEATVECFKGNVQ